MSSYTPTANKYNKNSHPDSIVNRYFPSQSTYVKNSGRFNNNIKEYQ